MFFDSTWDIELPRHNRPTLSRMPRYLLMDRDCPKCILLRPLASFLAIGGLMFVATKTDFSYTLHSCPIVPLE